MKAPPTHLQQVQQAQQPTLEESADYEVARVNTKATPAYKSHIQDLESQETAVAQKKAAPIAIAAKSPVAPPAVTETKKAIKKAEEKAEREAKAEKEAKG